MNKDLTELVLVLDRSGSMGSCVDDTEGGARNLLKEQREADGRCNVSYFRFDNTVERVYEGVDINSAEDIKLEPRGATALYDGIGQAINETGQRLSRLPEHERPGLVIVAIMTDGGENASVEYNSQKVKEMIEHQTDKYSWQFLFLGANQDAFATGGNIGISANKMSNYSTVNSQAAFKGTSNLVRSLRYASLEGASVCDMNAMSYSEEDKKSMNEPSKNVKSGITRQSIPRAVNKLKSYVTSG